jgi:hypothetical protein
MRRYTGTDTVPPGFYFNLRQWSFDAVERARPLRGGRTDVYRRVPALAVFLVAPLLGLAFVIFLPLIGFAVVAWLVGVKLAQVAADATRATVRVLRPGWEPALAFFSRARKTDARDEHADTWADDVRKQLDAPPEDER